MDRKLLYIYTSTPSVEILINEGIILLTGYLETAQAFVDNVPEIHTTQMCFMSYQYIVAGYDIILRDGRKQYRIGEDFIPACNHSRFQLLDLYQIGALFDAAY